MDSEIKKQIAEFLKQLKNTKYFQNIEFIIVYGSVLTEYHFEKSDIDICIYMKEKKEVLAEIRLNLLAEFPEKYDIQMFQLLPLYVQIEVLKGEVLYVKDEDFIYEIAYRTIDEWEDFYPIYKDYIES
jgi:hypothetical protein